MWNSIQQKDLEEVKQLLQHPKADINNLHYRPNHLGSPLHDAAGHSNKEIVEQLIKRHASLETVDQDGERPLH